MGSIYKIISITIVALFLVHVIGYYTPGYSYEYDSANTEDNHPTNSALKQSSEDYIRLQKELLEKEIALQGFIVFVVVLVLIAAIVLLYRNAQTRNDLEKKSEELRKAYRHAEDANISKSNFLASMSHDLRTPLNAILGYSESIELELHGPLNNETYKEYVSSIRSSGIMLLDLIDDLLDITKVESGKYDLTESEIHLPSVMKKTLEMAAPQAQEKAITIVCECPDVMPNLWADERVLVQILNNLISNSLKFTANNGKLEIAGHMAENGGIVISISDNGIGMSDDQLEKAMRPFEQINPEVTQNNMGTGLGLTLCVKYMELHDGQIEMVSKKDVGTTATLYFPASRTRKT